MRSYFFRRKQGIILFGLTGFIRNIKEMSDKTIEKFIDSLDRQDLRGLLKAISKEFPNVKICLEEIIKEVKRAEKENR